MNRISSRKNEIIKHTIALSSGKNKGENLFFVEGARLCYDAVRSQTKIFRLFYTQKALEKYGEYILKITPLAKEVYIIDEHVAGAISATKTTQGVFCICEKKQNVNEIKGKIVVLENLQDPGNLGTVFRTGEAVGINTFVLLGSCTDPYSPKVTRSSMGAIFRVNIIFIEKLDDLLQILNKQNYKTYAAVPKESAKKITQMTFGKNTAIFIGNEGNGLTDECIEKCENITIPMTGRAESLNASAAASIIMWEMMRNDG